MDSGGIFKRILADAFWVVARVVLVFAAGYLLVWLFILE